MRVCPCCHVQPAPAYRAMCRNCFRVIPQPMAKTLMVAWRRRVTDPVTYQETLLSVLLWRRDKG